MREGRRAGGADGSVDVPTSRDEHPMTTRCSRTGRSDRQCSGLSKRSHDAVGAARRGVDRKILCRVGPGRKATDAGDSTKHREEARPNSWTPLGTLSNQGGEGATLHDGWIPTPGRQ